MPACGELQTNAWHLPVQEWATLSPKLRSRLTTALVPPVQEWAALRAQGIQTPQIAAWQRLPVLPGSTFANTVRTKVMYNYVLNVYRAPQFQDVRTPPPPFLILYIRGLERALRHCAAWQQWAWPIIHALGIQHIEGHIPEHRRPQLRGHDG